MGVERRPADVELVQYDAQRPQVGCVVVRLLLQELRRHVERRALYRCEHRGLLRHGASEAKVAEHDARVGAEQDVLWLHVAVDHAVGVQVVERVDELSRDWQDRRLGERSVALEHLEEGARRKLGDGAECVLRLEAVEHLHDVWVAQRPENVPLLPQRRQLGGAVAYGRDELDGDDLPAVAAAPLVHLAKGALAH